MSDSKPKCAECGEELADIHASHQWKDCVDHLKKKVKELEPIPFVAAPPVVNFAPSLAVVTTSGWSYDRARRVWEWRIRLESVFAIAEHIIDSYKMPAEEFEREVEEQIRRGLINAAKGPLNISKRVS